MNNRYLKKIMVIFLTIIIVSTGGCSFVTKTTDNGFINNDVYENEEYWSEDALNMVTNLSIVRNEVNDNFENQNFYELSEKQVRKVAKLKKTICKFFIQRYKIDFSDELEKQQVTFFSTSSIGNGITMGYVDVNNYNILHLNVLLNTENKELFESTYIHESLHQLGFNDKKCKVTYLVEGIVDAYTDLILTENGGNSQPTDLYFEARQFGYQMIAADPNLPKVFVNKESLREYVNKSLNSYQQKYVKHNDLAIYLNALLEALIAINSGTGYSENTYYYAFDAQSIVQRFCQAQNCDSHTINYIRSHYILEDFERLKVIDHGEKVYSIQ